MLNRRNRVKRSYLSFFRSVNLLFFKFWLISALKIHFFLIILFFFRFVHTVRCYVKGVGAPDGELDLFELYTFFSVISIMVALALRIHVNTATNYPKIIEALPSDNSTSFMPLCSQFSVAAASLTKIGQLAHNISIIATIRW